MPSKKKNSNKRHHSKSTSSNTNPPNTNDPNEFPSIHSTPQTSTTSSPITPHTNEIPNMYHHSNQIQSDMNNDHSKDKTESSQKEEEESMTHTNVRVLRLSSTFPTNRALLSNTEPAQAGISDTKATSIVVEHDPVINQSDHYLNSSSISEEKLTNVQTDTEVRSKISQDSAHQVDDTETKVKLNKNQDSDQQVDTTETKVGNEPETRRSQDSNRLDNQVDDHKFTTTQGQELQKDEEKSRDINKEPESVQDSGTEGIGSNSIKSRQFSKSTTDGRKHAERCKRAMSGINHYNSRNRFIGNDSDADDEAVSNNQAFNAIEIHLSYLDQNATGTLNLLDSFNAIRKLGFNLLFSTCITITLHLILTPYIGIGTFLKPDLKGRCRIPFRELKPSELTEAWSPPMLGNNSSTRKVVGKGLGSDEINPLVIWEEMKSIEDPIGLARLIIGWLIVVLITSPWDLTVKRELIEGVYNGNLFFLIANSREQGSKFGHESKFNLNNDQILQKEKDVKGMNQVNFKPTLEIQNQIKN
ncbi:hypothetical protein CROQUDRAFT_131859 [Cronartium quercuum f. sp. fusiforme G11]|uniref:Uncharacterized protein n=1 Tax=Cronartium quercuum f. sp. fusiforme G11 TaxID=708437 RepID=A0A9P6TDI7_9BASI|nr:hypothetical protein CROQUDRAFT_131859 [Cronartium quercuum f. sp. fusiforme G11]